MYVTLQKFSHKYENPNRVARGTPTMVLRSSDLHGQIVFEIRSFFLARLFIS